VPLPLPEIAEGSRSREPLPARVVFVIFPKNLPAVLIYKRRACCPLTV